MDSIFTYGNQELYFDLYYSRKSFICNGMVEYLLDDKEKRGSFQRIVLDCPKCKDHP